MSKKRTCTFCLKKSLFLLVISLIIIFGVFFTITDNADVQVQEQNQSTDSYSDEYLIDPSQILSGGPPPDGIPSIDNPQFISVQEADEWITDNELIMVLDYKDQVKVYPLQIMVWHEIVNDVVSEFVIPNDPLADAYERKHPLVITYCPLCGSGIAYSRVVNNTVLEFGTSGKLYNSNLLMYDRQNGAYWTQIEGQAINGSYMGTKLDPISLDTVSWGEWRSVNEEGLVLSRDTGFEREYGRDPYGNYYNDSFLIFPVEQTDERIFAKDVIFGIEVEGVYKAYREENIIAEAPFTDVVNGVELTVTRSESGIVRFTDAQGNVFVKERDFWFAWYAFHPNTTVYGLE